MAKFSRPGESRWTKQWTPYGGIANVVARMVELERLEVVLEGVADDDATSDERGDVCAHLREFRADESTCRGNIPDTCVR